MNKISNSFGHKIWLTIKIKNQDQIKIFSHHNQDHIEEEGENKIFREKGL